MKKIIAKISFWIAWVSQEIQNLFLPEEKRRKVIELDLPEDVVQALKEEAMRRNVDLDTVVNDALKCVVCGHEQQTTKVEETRQRPKRNKK